MTDNSLQSDYLNALVKLNHTLEESQTTVEHKGIKITLTAQPKIIAIHLPQDVAIQALENDLVEGINRALTTSAQVVFEQASKELDKK